MNQLNNSKLNTQDSQKNSYALNGAGDISSVLAIENNYGKRELLSENIKKELQEILNAFSEFFISRGYKGHASTSINAGIDPSVYFIGAPISVLKPYILNGEIPEEGFHITQPCIRTKNTKIMFDDQNIPNWGSYFPGIVALSKYEKLKKICEDSIDFLINCLQIPQDNVIIRVNSGDKDLLEAISAAKTKIYLEIDSRPIEYYKHKYGMGKIVGRNFNFALRHRGTEKFNDIGNLIAIEDDNKRYGVELALGATTIMSELFHLDHILGTSVISHIIKQNEGLHIKLKDCIMSAVAIMRTGERPHASNTKGRVLRTYIRGLLYFAKKLGIENKDLESYINEFEKLEFGGSAGIVIKIMHYIRIYEQDIRSKKELGVEEQKIKNLL